ncbi:hypothetical protein Tco_0415880 [Tanacetum coccineum]
MAGSQCRMFRGDRLGVMQVVEQRVMLLEHGVTEIWELLQQIRQRLFVVTTIGVKALESGVTLDEEKLSFLADLGDRIDSGPNTQTLATTAIVQTDDLDAFDSDYNEAPSASVVLMAKLSAYDSDVIFEVPIQDTYQDNYVLDHSVQEIKKSEVVQGTTSPEKQDAMIISVIEEMSNQVAKCNAVNKKNKTVNESLTAELERYKEHGKIFEERPKFDSNDHKKYIDYQIHKNLSTTVEVLKKESKEKQDKYIEEIIDLEKKKKAFENIVFKQGTITRILTPSLAYPDDVTRNPDTVSTCMTRSSTSELFTPYKELEREFRSSRRHFKTLSLDELRSPDFNSFSNQEYSEEEVAETMAETME